MKLMNLATLPVVVILLFASCGHAGKPIDCGIEPPPPTPELTPAMLLPLMTMNPLLSPTQAEIPKPVPDCGGGRYCVPSYVFNATVDTDSVRDAVCWLEQAKKLNPKAILFELNTKGGGVDQGFRLIRALENAMVPVYCVAEHEVVSEGFAILQACSTRLMTRRTQLMTHQPYIPALSGAQHVEDLENALQDLRTTVSAHAEQCARRLKISRAEYDAKVSNKQDWFMDADEALKVGAIDVIAPSTPWVKSVLETFGGY
jgi:ATP-dependent protease ClpP protease subunit